MYISFTGDVFLKDIIDPTFRASWIAHKLMVAKTQYMDGINIDIEQEVNCSSPEYDALTALVKETTESFHREIEGSQVKIHLIFFGNPLISLSKCIHEGISNRISVYRNRVERISTHISLKIIWKFEGCIKEVLQSFKVLDLFFMDIKIQHGFPIFLPHRRVSDIRWAKGISKSQERTPQLPVSP